MAFNSHIDDIDGIKKSVWYGGTDALKKGEAVCYNTDYGTATTAEASRSKRVERPTVSNNTAFAGVAVSDYSAQSGGQTIEIYVPGSKCVPVALGVDTVINTGLLTFTTCGRYDVGVEGGDGSEGGRFYTGKYVGRGSAVPRQTVTAILEASMTGAWSLANDGVTLTVSDTTGISAGDTVVLVGGEDDATDAIVPGKYTVSSVTNSTVLVLTSSAMDQTTPTSALACTGYCYTANPTALCQLLDGEESGGIEFMSPPDAGVTGMPYMVSGLTYICAGVTCAADVDVTFAQGTLPGDKKAFICLGTLTTKPVTIALATAGITVAAGALAEVTALDAAGDACYLEFNGARWFCKDTSGGATEA